MPFQHPREAAQAHFQRLWDLDFLNSREAIYQQIRNCTLDDLARASEVLAKYASDPFVRVITSREASARAGIDRIVSIDD
jgi:hypothetical protein